MTLILLHFISLVLLTCFKINSDTNSSFGWGILLLTINQRCYVSWTAARHLGKCP